MVAVATSNVVENINWSAIVRPRIESELANLERPRGDATSAIERLRASKLASEKQDLIDGKADGRRWAAMTAEYRTLRRLQLSAARYENAWDRPGKQLRS
jgi:hypothetical protein